MGVGYVQHRGLGFGLSPFKFAVEGVAEGFRLVLSPQDDPSGHENA
ncbi:hypothetical protein LRE75_01475 [Streptomyces sp. 372A]